MNDLLHDFIFGWRQLRKRASLTVAATVCIALGIGANTAVFSFVDALFLRRPPVKEPETLVRLFADWSDVSPYGAFSYPDFLDVRKQSDVLEDVVGEAPVPLQVSADERRERLWGSAVSANYFRMLGVKLALGRGFLAEEDSAAAPPVVVLSHGIWQRLFGEARDILQKEIVLNGQDFRVVGVAGKNFQGTNLGLAPELWLPLPMLERVGAGRYDFNSRGDQWLSFVIGRLKPDVTLAQARASLQTLMEHLAETYPETNVGKSVRLLPEAEASLHPAVRGMFASFLTMASVVVVLILLLACANVAGLLLSGAANRSREMSIRLALGASRGRLVRQLLCESLLLALLGGVAGVLAAAWLLDLLRSYRIPLDVPVSFQVQLDQRMLIFGALASLLMGLVFGLTPALQASRPQLMPSLQGRGLSGERRASSLRRLLVVGQIGLSLSLLIGSGLGLRSLWSAARIDPGFDPDHQLIASLDLDLQGYDESRGRRFLEELKTRAEALPGVSVAGYSGLLPFGLLRNQTSVLPEGYQPSKEGDWPSVDLDIVDEDYFEAAGVPILRGRAFASSDDQDAEPVIIVNQTFADRFWPGQNPLGKRVRAAGKDWRVIGLTPAGKYHSLGEAPTPYLYLALKQDYAGMVILHLRTAADPVSLMGAVRQLVESLDPTLPIAGLGTMSAQLGVALLPARLAAGVVSSFALLALLLACVGLYGVIAHLVSCRRREIGIRKALGAFNQQVLRLILGQALKLVAAGVLLGLLAGAALSQLMGGLLYGTSVSDPEAYLLALVSLLAAVLVVVLVPAWRGSRIDPASALRFE